MNAFQYFELRNRLSEDIRLGIVEPRPAPMVDRVAACAGITRGDAAEAVERFLVDLRREMDRRRPGPQ